MSITNRLKYCSVCQNRKMDRNIGLICSLTNEKAAFTGKCEDFVNDETEAQRKLSMEMQAAGDIHTSEDSSPTRTTTFGIIILIIGLLISLSGVVIAYGAVITGILMIIKGQRQANILQEHEAFKRRK